MKIKLTSEQKEKWIQTLESNKYKKGTGQLHDTTDNSYCCLGVLCHVVDISIEEQSKKSTDYQAFQDIFGDEILHELIDINDAGPNNDKDFTDVIKLIKTLKTCKHESLKTTV